MALALTNIPKSLFYSLETNERIFLVVQAKSKAKLEVSEGRERRIKPIYPLVILLPLHKSCVPDAEQKKILIIIIIGCLP